MAWLLSEAELLDSGLSGSKKDKQNIIIDFSSRKIVIFYQNLYFYVPLKLVFEITLKQILTKNKNTFFCNINLWFNLTK